jgi:uncharacterized membrane protein YgcG
MRSRFVAFVAAIAMILGLGVAACSDDPPTPPVPATWYVSYMGTNYCPWQYDVHETQMYPGMVGTCVPIQAPSVSVMPMLGTPQYAVMQYMTMYSDFYESDYWYYHYYAPINSRLHVNITVVPYSAYMSNVTIYRTTYRTQIATNSRTATWKGKSGTTTGSYKFPTTNAKEANKVMTNTKTGGGGGTSNSRTGSGSIGGNSGGSRTGSGSVGKPGRR